MQPQGESIWGNINLCIEIALDIYFMIGENGEGIVVPKERAEEVFSEKNSRGRKGSRRLSVLSQRGHHGNAIV